MMHKLLSFLLLFSAGFSSTWAQIDVDDIVFDHETYNFGTVPFGNQTINATFIFTNNSEFDFEIKDVEASCGCTVPSWPDKPIKPGMKGVITARFDPTNLAGEVDKDIEIFANFNRVMSKRLRIRGTIQEPIRGELDKYVPGQFGYLRLSGQVLGFGDISSNDSVTKQFWIVNDYNRSLKIKGIEKAPEWVDVKFEKLELESGDTCMVDVTVHAGKINDLGRINERILIATYDRFFRTKSLMLAMEITHDFGDMKRKDWRKKPTISLESKTIDLGTGKEGSKISKSITIKNTGKTPLKILKVKADCSCTVLTNLDREIPPGGTVNTAITLDTIFLHDRVTKSVTLFTNDPSNPKVELTVVANVIEN